MDVRIHPVPDPVHELDLGAEKIQVATAHVAWAVQEEANQALGLSPRPGGGGSCALRGGAEKRRTAKVLTRDPRNHAI
jgi:hypothetical protein